MQDPENHHAKSRLGHDRTYWSVRIVGIMFVGIFRELNIACRPGKEEKTDRFTELSYRQSGYNLSTGLKVVVVAAAALREKGPARSLRSFGKS